MSLSKQAEEKNFPIRTSPAEVRKFDLELESKLELKSHLLIPRIGRRILESRKMECEFAYSLGSTFLLQQNNKFDHFLKILSAGSAIAGRMFAY